MSRGVVTVSRRFDVDDSALNAVRKSESPFWMVVVPPAPVRSMSPADTDLSVQMRPTFWVVSSNPQSFHVPVVMGSAAAWAPSVAAAANVGGAIEKAPVIASMHAIRHSRAVRTVFFIGPHRFLCCMSRTIQQKRRGGIYPAVVNIRAKNGQKVPRGSLRMFQMQARRQETPRRGGVPR